MIIEGCWWGSYEILSAGEGVVGLFDFSIVIFLLFSVFAVEFFGPAAVEDDVHDSCYEEEDGGYPGENLAIL